MLMSPLSTDGQTECEDRAILKQNLQLGTIFVFYGDGMQLVETTHRIVCCSGKLADKAIVMQDLMPRMEKE